MATQWQIGDRIQNRWQIYKILGGPGKSGMGIVYIVYDHEWHEAFAAKTFQERFFTARETRDRFIQEAHTWINLDIHQYIVRARFVEVISGRPFLFLEYVTGGDLSRWIGTPRLTLERTLRYAVQFCYGMEYALSKGVKAHRDIKPANVLLTEDGTLKITDFGLARVAAETGEGADGMGGTPEYMPPEQWRSFGQADVRADVYSFGVMLYEMVSGQPLFGERPKVSQRELERRHRTQAPPSLRGRLPRGMEGVEVVVQRCLRKEAAKRYENFGVLRRELVKLYERLTGESAPTPVVGKPLNAIDWNNKGYSLGALRRYDEEIICLDRALAIDPQYKEAWNNKGAVLRDLGQYDEALACCDCALEIDPQYGDAWVNKGAALAGLGRYGEALACCDRALAIDSYLAGAWINKGMALKELGRLREALLCYDRALAIDPQFAMAWCDKGAALGKLGRPREALACFNRALVIDPQFKEVWYNKGVELMELRRRDEALACYDRALAIDSQYKEAWHNKGVALGKLRRPEEALACLDRALAIDPQFKEAWLNKGAALDELGRPREALLCYDRALAIDPQFAMAWHNKGAALYNNFRRYREALECFQRAQRLGYAPAAQAIALCLQALRR